MRELADFVSPISHSLAGHYSWLRAKLGELRLDCTHTFISLSCAFPEAWQCHITCVPLAASARHDSRNALSGL